MLWRRTLQPQALNLVRVLPIDNAAWVSAKVAAFPHLVHSSRYWAELRDDVLILYPAGQLFVQHHKLTVAPSSSVSPPPPPPPLLSQTVPNMAAGHMPVCSNPAPMSASAPAQPLPSPPPLVPPNSTPVTTPNSSVSTPLVSDRQRVYTNPHGYQTALRPVPDSLSLEQLPFSHILRLAESVPSSEVVAFVLSSVRLVCRENARTICIRPLRARAAAHVTFASVNQVSQWRDDFSRAVLRERKRLSDFRILRHIGKGASGRVYEIEDKVSNERLALKVIEKTTVFESRDTYRHAMDERLVLQMIRHHPYILDLRFAFQNNKRLFLVTEYCPGGDLFEYMNRLVSPLDEDTARFISAQVLLALAHLHAQGIVYRDLKLENILLDKHGHVRLADFGLTKVLRQHDGSLARTNTFCGTREYVAPEMLRGDPYDTSLDFWTFGILLFEMLSGRTPFYTSDHSEIYRRIEKSPVFYPRNLSSDVRALIGKLLVRDPQRRLGVTRGGIAAIQNHAWFKSIDWDAMMDRESLQSPLIRSSIFQQRLHEKRCRTSSSVSPVIPVLSPAAVCRRKNRKQMKQERALANVVADVQADLRFASSKLDRSAVFSAGSASGSLLGGFGRPRSSPYSKSGDVVLAGYSFNDHRHHRRRAVSDSDGAFSVRSASAVHATRSAWTTTEGGERNGHFGESYEQFGRIEADDDDDEGLYDMPRSCATVPAFSPGTWDASSRVESFTAQPDERPHGPPSHTAEFLTDPSTPTFTEVSTESSSTPATSASALGDGNRYRIAFRLRSQRSDSTAQQVATGHAHNHVTGAADGDAQNDNSKRVQSDSPTCIRTPPKERSISARRATSSTSQGAFG